MADTVGTNHADTLFANGLSKVYGRAGDDTVHGDGTGNYIDGGRGADVLLANGGASYVIGGASNDHIDLGNDPNARDAQGYGGSGNDVIIGSWNCKLFGNSGADFLHVVAGSAEGGTGQDTILSGLITGSNASVHGGKGADLFLADFWEGHTGLGRIEDFGVGKDEIQLRDRQFDDLGNVFEVPDAFGRLDVNDDGLLNVADGLVRPDAISGVDSLHLTIGLGTLVVHGVTQLATSDFIV